jgi:hypothetical protein
MISTSTCLIVTGSELMPSTQADSHGAGQSRPVNSGKLLVACSRSDASYQSCRQTRSFHSGMRLPSGQPVWQNGMPQSMHRPAWRSRRPAGKSWYTSRQSRIRTSTGRRAGVSRGVVKNPLGSAIGRSSFASVGHAPLRVRRLNSAGPGAVGGSHTWAAAHTDAAQASGDDQPCEAAMTASFTSRPSRSAIMVALSTRL